MALLFNNTGESLALAIMVNKTAAANLTYHLYSNDKTPSETDVLTDYTEASAAGYSAITTTGASWDTTSVSGSASYAQQTFTFTTDETVYGYFVKKGTTMLFSERFSGAPFSIPTSGGTVAVTPKITAD
ncbi:hypothetical protein Pla110_32880 [Polystyrenella longa]|uniref:Uncharacterized protein n=1 Tax=Polystyrenella longa TaxID=2528007 RepID=A0A518CQP2_9PLAN|nr:hypothetical protein [Polystyrenella longa]QDU81546.1 hypothetical protein Pla110_32880 [Polystyrenella longa]